MKRFIILTLILVLIAAVFFYMGYEPSLSEVDISGSLFGYDIQTSKYTLLGALISLIIFISSFLRFFMGIRNIYRSVINFFLGRNKDKATESLLNAYAYVIGNRPKTAQTYLKKAEKYFKDTPHTALLKLVVDQANHNDRPNSKPLALVENDKTLNPIGAYIEAIYPVSQKDDARMSDLLEKAQSFSENPDDLYTYLKILIQDNQFEKAENALKSARSVLPENDYKFHLSSLYLLRSVHAQTEKQPDQMLAYGLEAAKYDKKNPAIMHQIIQAYKTLQRDNKAVRMLNDYFSHSPELGYVKLFLELKGLENPEETGKRIAALPRNFENSEAFIALQAYHFTTARDFISLATAINNAHNFNDSLWLKAAKLCLAVEKDTFLLTEAAKIFKESLYAIYRQYITDIYAHNNGLIYLEYLTQNNLLPDITPTEVIAKLSLFKDMLKAIPVMHQKTNLHNHDSLGKPDLHKLEANIYKNS